MDVEVVTVARSSAIVETSFLEMDTSRERVLVRSILVVIVEGTVEEAVDIGGGN